MKIGFLGNANNYPFMLARAIRELGCEVVFIVDSQNPLNRPEKRYSDITFPYPSWIHDFSDVELWRYPKPNEGVLRDIVSLLRDCDALVLNEFGLSLWSRIKKPSFALLTGTDLEVLADLRYADIATGINDLSLYSIINIFSWRKLFTQHKIRHHLLKLITAQREAISSAIVVNYFPPGVVTNADRLLSELKVSDSKRIYCMQSEIERYDYADQPKNKFLKLFNVARIQWKKPDSDFICELDYKGTDLLIKGLALYVKRNELPIEIRLVRKGCDLEYAYQLIKDEGIERYVIWLDAMDQNALYEEYKNADIVLDHFGQGMFGMGTLDAMAVGRPVVTNGRIDVLSEALEEIPPICNATTPEEICSQLEMLSSSPSLRESIGKKSRAYVEKHCAPEKYAKIILDKFESAYEK